MHVYYVLDSNIQIDSLFESNAHYHWFFKKKSKSWLLIQIWSIVIAQCYQYQYCQWWSWQVGKYIHFHWRLHQDLCHIRNLIYFSDDQCNWCAEVSLVGITEGSWTFWKFLFSICYSSETQPSPKHCLLWNLHWNSVQYCNLFLFWMQWKTLPGLQTWPWDF